MKFSKISITSRGVHLIRQTKTESGATEKFDLESPEGPLKSFSDAMQKFADYVIGLLPFLVRDDDDEEDEDALPMTVTTVNLSESKDGRRGLQVSVNVPIEALNNKVVSITTPIVHEAGENTSDEVYTLPDDVMSLIKLLEGEATRYYKGEREQGELFAGAEAKAEAEKSPAAESFNERAAAAEVASTRKPRGRKKAPTGAAAPTEIQNPDKTKPPTTEHIRDLLVAVGKEVPVDAIDRWASSERDAAQLWAEKSAKGVASNMPLCVQRDALKPLPAFVQ